MHGFLTVLLLLVVSHTSAQNAPRALRGAWQIETPERGSLILILKGQGLASFFWGKMRITPSTKARWSGTEERAEATWPDGSSLVLEQGTNGFQVVATNGRDGSTFTSTARRLPEQVLGQWAKPPARDRSNLGDARGSVGFFGIWMIGDEADKFVFVEPDRSAASNANDSTRGQRGQWARQGSELHIIWDNGKYSIIGDTERGYTYKKVESGKVIEEDSTETVSAIRTNDSQSPRMAGGLSSRTRNRERWFAFSSRRAARAFYRGDWIIRRAASASNASKSSASAASTPLQTALSEDSGARAGKTFSCAGTTVCARSSPQSVRASCSTNTAPAAHSTACPNRVLAAAPRILQSLKNTSQAAAKSPSKCERPLWLPASPKPLKKRAVSDAPLPAGSGPSAKKRFREHRSTFGK